MIITGTVTDGWYAIRAEAKKQQRTDAFRIPKKFVTVLVMEVALDKQVIISPEFIEICLSYGWVRAELNA
jgi:lipopolysaccharide biosynthesis regulator YciM